MAFTAKDRDALLKDPRSFLDGIYYTVSSTCNSPTLSGKPDRLTFGEPAMPSFAYRLIDVGKDGNDTGLRPVPTYNLRKATDPNDVMFDAYIVKYKVGETPQTVLGHDATLCFTANMNGCTFGIGSQASPTDSLLVTHSNSPNKDGQAAANQRKDASMLVGTGGQLFEPEHYRTGGLGQALLFGFYKPGQKWQFCYLRYRRSKPGQPPISHVISHGVKDVTTNSVSG